MSAFELFIPLLKYVKYVRYIRNYPFSIEKVILFDYYNLDRYIAVHHFESWAQCAEITGVVRSSTATSHEYYRHYDLVFFDTLCQNVLYSLLFGGHFNNIAYFISKAII